MACGCGQTYEERQAARAERIRLRDERREERRQEAARKRAERLGKVVTPREPS